MLDLERLITFVTAQYRWGLHPLKVALALLLPVFLLWTADRQVRRLARAIEDRDARQDHVAGVPSTTGRD